MRPPKFAFVPLAVASERGGPSDAKATLSPSGQFVLNGAAVRAHALEGKAVEFLYDSSRRALGFRVLAGDLTKGADAFSKSARIVKVDAASGVARLAVGRLLKSAGLRGLAARSMPLRVHDELSSGHRIYYVELPDADARPEFD